MEELRPLRDIRHVRCRRGDAVDHAGHGVHANVRLHAEVLLLALPDLVHLGIALPRPVRRRRGASRMVTSMIVPARNCTL